jgi:hypothetical protein
MDQKKSTAFCGNVVSKKYKPKRLESSATGLIDRDEKH